MQRRERLGEEEVGSRVVRAAFDDVAGVAGPRRTVGDVRDPITALERAIQSLPAATRAAMLQGIRENPIVCGAYTDGRGGI